MLWSWQDKVFYVAFHPCTPKHSLWALQSRHYREKDL